MIAGLRNLIADISEGLPAQSFFQLGKVQAGRMNLLIRGIRDSQRQGRGAVKRPWGWQVGSCAANHPVVRTRWLLYHIVLSHAIPGYRPCSAPPVPGAHGTTVLEVDTPVGNLAVVGQNPGSPTLVPFRTTVSGKHAVEQHNGSGYPGTCCSMPDVVAMT